MDQPVPTIVVESPKTNWLLFSFVGVVILATGIVAGLLIGKYIYTPKSIPPPIAPTSPTPTIIIDPTAV